MLKIFVGSSATYHPHWGKGGEGANSIPQTTQLNFRKRFIYVQSTKISLFTSLFMVLRKVQLYKDIRSLCYQVSQRDHSKMAKRSISGAFVYRRNVKRRCEELSLLATSSASSQSVQIVGGRSRFHLHTYRKRSAQ